MTNHLVMTVSGPDRVGVVERVTGIILDYGGNVESSRMARLGGEFTMLMLVSVPEDGFQELREGVRKLREDDFRIITRSTERGSASRFSGWIPYEVIVKGADHEGIIHQITRRLAERGIHIESLDTDVVKAPMSGVPLFRMKAIVLIPPDLALRDVRQMLESAADELGIDTGIVAYAG